MFTIINGIEVNLGDYLSDEKLINQLENDSSFVNNVSFSFEKEFSWAEDDVSSDEILETVIMKEIFKRCST